MGHVGEEVGLVLTGLLQFPRLEPQGGGSALQIIALGFQHLSLLLELAVGLFQLRLLLFQTHLGFLEGAPLLFQFLVRDPKLFALDLKLLGLTLGLLQHVLQSGAIAG
ncbi:hypothetical protein D3C79_986710 [compost metagenome]